MSIQVRVLLSRLPDLARFLSRFPDPVRGISRGAEIVRGILPLSEDPNTALLIGPLSSSCPLELVLMAAPVVDEELTNEISEKRL